ncbi:MAG TPA: lipoate--protein ligase [Balneolaceae bacterium]
MIFIENEGINDPHINLALEEYALRNFSHDQDYLLFYINEPSIIIGRNQNTLEEINHEYVEKKGIHVVRRISGGGAVYHDLGNLNFSFITNYDKKSLNNFRKFTKPVIRVLNEMGVTAELKGRNDIVVNNRKISGNAQFSTGKRMFSHGTLLFDSEMSEVANALNVKMSKIESKGHKSVRSRVANISEFLDEFMDIKTFRSQVLKGLYEDREEFETYHLTKTEWEKVHELKDKKYADWDWNYGSSPKFNIRRTQRFPIGEIDLRIDVEKGLIKNMKIYGDFFGSEPVETLENHLIGNRYDRGELEQLLHPVEIENYFGTLPKTEFLELVYGADE